MRNNLVTDSLLSAKDMLAILHVQELGERAHVCALNNLEICFLLNNKAADHRLGRKPLTKGRKKRTGRLLHFWLKWVMFL